MTDDLGDCPEDPVLRVQQCSTSGPLTQVVIYKSTMDAKLAKHSELAAAGHGVEEIAQTFSKPAAVYDGNIPGQNFVYMSDTYNFHGHPMIATAQRVGDTNSGRFTTAYYTSDFKDRPPLKLEGTDD